MINLASILISPIDGARLQKEGDIFISASGHSFPIVEGIPVLLPPNTSDTIGAMSASRTVGSSSRGPAAQCADPYYLETLGLTPEQRLQFRAEVGANQHEIDPVVAHMVGHTCGNLYNKFVGRLPRYPIPNFRIKNGEGKLLLDLGCNWGRWCLAAAREGFIPIGLDPQFGAVLAAQRVAKQLGVKAHFICADARHLPFRPDSFDAVFSYSVLQHLAREDVTMITKECRRVLKKGGESLIQMPNAFGIRCLQHQIKRRFRKPQNFEVRYWTPWHLRSLFAREMGPTRLEIDCFFGLGLQQSDLDLMRFPYSTLVRISELLRRIPLLVPVADSLYVHSHCMK